jgi:hypothetical protein
MQIAKGETEEHGNRTLARERLAGEGARLHMIAMTKHLFQGV